MHRRHLAACLVVTTLLVAGPALAQPDCDKLDGKARERADDLLADLYIHDCCDQVLADCLRAEPVCSLATRLAANVCRRIAQRQDDEQIRRALAGRARTMLPGYEPAIFDLDGVPMAGELGAPIEVVEFADARGTHCARVTPGLHQAVVDGPLKGKVRLYLVLFPLRSNPHAKEAGLAALAAHDLGGFWEYLLHAYAHFESFSVEDLPHWAEDIGLDRAHLEELYADPALTERLKAGKLAGLEHGVKGTPTFFIEGRRYEGELEVEELIDVLEEVHERQLGLSSTSEGG